MGVIWNYFAICMDHWSSIYVVGITVLDIQYGRIAYIYFRGISTIDTSIKKLVGTTKLYEYDYIWVKAGDKCVYKN